MGGDPMACLIATCRAQIDLQPARHCLLHDVLHPVIAILGRSTESGPVLSVTTDVPLWVEVDALRLKQVRLVP